MKELTAGTNIPDARFPMLAITISASVISPRSNRRQSAGWNP